MSEKKGPFDWIKDKFFQTGEQKVTEKKGGKLQYFFILLLAGVAFMLITNIWQSSSKKSSAVSLNTSAPPKSVAAFSTSSKKQSKALTGKDYEERYQNELKDTLSQIAGVGAVDVVVNVDASESKVYEKDSTIHNQTTTESDQKGGERKIEDLSKDEKLAIVRQGDKEVPLVTETKKPKITGVLVVAEGAGDITIKALIKEAVSTALDVPSYRVSVMPKKN